MNRIIGVLHRGIRRLTPSSVVGPDIGQRIQADEQEAARQRLLVQARAVARRQ